VHLHKRSAVTTTVRMDSVGNDLLARSSFTLNQNGDVGFGDRSYLAANIADLRTLSNDRRAIFSLPHRRISRRDGRPRYNTFARDKKNVAGLVPRKPVVMDIDSKRIPLFST